LHVEKQTGVAGVINSFALGGDENARRVAHVEEAGIRLVTGAVVGDGQLDTVRAQNV
jgi:hypothetical protein